MAARTPTFPIAASARALAAIALLGLAPIPDGHAADMRDPTRPPAQHRESNVPPPPAATPASAPLLQSILIGEGRKPSAIIDGRLVQLGEDYERMRLTRITETHAVLSGANGQTTLQLTPGAAKQSSAPTTFAERTQTLPTRRAGATTASLPLRVAEQP